MNRRLVKRVLAAKHEDFLKSIKDEHVRTLVKDCAYITGGAIASLLLKEEVKDFDYYFTNKETVKAVAEYYVKEFLELHPDSNSIPHVVEEGDRIKIMVKSAGVVTETNFENMPDGDEDVVKLLNETVEKEEEMPPLAEEKYRPIFMSSNAITLSNKVQLVLRFYGEPEQVHKNYDFIHCTNYWIPNDDLYLNEKALESLLTKQLFYAGSLYPICSVIRTRKFLMRGWYINAGQYLKMCFQISELDLNNFKVLEEQLIGVDAAYFHQILEYCRKRVEEDPNFKIDSTYLISIVDKIF